MARIFFGENRARQQFAEQLAYTCTHRAFHLYMQHERVGNRSAQQLADLREIRDRAARLREALSEYVNL